MWLQKKKRTAVLGTVRSTIRNMIQGVTVGYKFRMVLAYSHFPVVVNILDNGTVYLFLFRESKLRTFWASSWTRESMPPRESLLPRRKNKKITSLSKASTLKTSLNSVLESNRPQSSKTRISEPSSTVSTSKTPDCNLPIDQYLNIYLQSSYHLKTSSI